MLTEDPLSCLGYGIIRAIDMERKVFYIMTPLPLVTLDKVNVLSHGAVDLPNSLFFAQVCKLVKFNYLFFDILLPATTTV